ncbi:MAG TPA: tetratricopeptide repeat protein, partial [Candidatus Eisenbacteria bacterium]
WSWPTYGAPDVNWSWGFSALLWPVWERAGVWGLFAWRWVTALVAFGFLWGAARRMGARGFAPLVVMVVCSLVWRARSQVRPETLAAVLLAAELWILETRRQGGKDHAWWLVPLAWVWANVHNTWFLGLGLIGVHLLDDLWAGRAAEPRGASAAASGGGGWWRLAWVGLAALAISFANPFGWRALWQPFDFFLHQRNEVIFSTIGEMGPIDWDAFWRTGLPLLVGGWPILLLVRARRAGLDAAEALTCLIFTALVLRAQRFVGLYALVAAPYVARDLHHAVAARASGFRLLPGLRAALTSLACVAAGLPEWTRPGVALGVGFVWTQYPVAACDFIEAHGVRGRGFNQFGFAGYQLYRFWPDRSRLPFIDIHQAGTRADRDLYAWAQQRDDRWHELDGRYAFDYALLGRADHRSLLDALDADSTWAVVFLDDVMALYVRTAGPMAAVARAFGYRHLPAGTSRLGALAEACARDSLLRSRTAAELDREVQGSPCHSRALVLLSTMALEEGRFADGRRLLEQALAVDPNRIGAHWRLARLALEEGRPRDALREAGLERHVTGPSAPVDVVAGKAWVALGDRDRALAAFRKAAARDSSNQEARDSLRALGVGG